jgi:hypothetical protein
MVTNYLFSIRYATEAIARSLQKGYISRRPPSY